MPCADEDQPSPASEPASLANSLRCCCCLGSCSGCTEELVLAAAIFGVSAYSEPSDSGAPPAETYAACIERIDWRYVHCSLK